MGEQLFDDLARALAEPMPRRRALGLLLALVAGTLRGPRPARASAFVCGTGQWRCGDEETGHCCVGAETCCPAPAPAGGCCGEGKRCGPVRRDGRGTCVGCPKGQAACGDTCCGMDEECRNPKKEGICCDRNAGEVCGDRCCPSGEKCVDGECDGVCHWWELNRRHEAGYDKKSECCTGDGPKPRYPIADRDWAYCQDTRVPHAGHKPSSNGCGTEDHPVSDHYKKANFKPACDAHDMCYETCRKDRKACDVAFYGRLKSACVQTYAKGSSNRAACLEKAGDYYDGVRILGYSAYADAQRKACDCC